ncbi:MAG TPA: nuclear transport factor 2 family protein [Ilumatobacteraceae bacterium]|jgi:hypothetical protein
MPDDFDRVVADRFKVLDDVHVPDTWSRVQFKVLDRTDPTRRVRSVGGIDASASAPSPVQPRETDAPNTNQESEEIMPTENPPTTNWRWWPLAAAAAVVALVIAGLVLLARDDSPSGPVDTPTTTEEPFRPGDAMSTADDYFERYNAGDITGVLALFAPGSTFTDTFGTFVGEPGPIESWALGLEWKLAGQTQLVDRTCSSPGPNGSAPLSTQPGPTAGAVTEQLRVVCEYGEHDAVTQAAGRDPVPIRLTLVIGPDGIREWSRVIGQPDFIGCCQDFRDWAESVRRADPDTWDYGVPGASAEEARAAGELYGRLAEEWVAFTTPGETASAPRVCKSPCSATQPDDSSGPTSPSTSQPG